MPSSQSVSALLNPDCKPLRINPQKPKPANTLKKPGKKQCVPSGPPPTAAESDYTQNGLQLPQNPENLRLLLQDVDKKGFLDKEYNYQLRKKEAVAEIKDEIKDKLKNPPEPGDMPSVLYKPLLEDSGFLSFADAFRLVLAAEC